MSSDEYCSKSGINISTKVTGKTGKGIMQRDRDKYKATEDSRRKKKKRNG